MKSVLYRNFRRSVLLIANYSCHCETYRIHGTAISSLTDGHETQSLSPWQPWTCRGSCPRTLSLAMEWKDFFAKPKCEPATSHTCGVVKAISLQATLVFGLLRYARNDKNQDRHTTFAMTSCFSATLAGRVLQKPISLGNANSHKCGCRSSRL